MDVGQMAGEPSRDHGMNSRSNLFSDTDPMNFRRPSTDKDMDLTPMSHSWTYRALDHDRSGAASLSK